MKKRKELNALIGLGDSKRKKTKKGSGHRLLRTEPPDSESDSSSEDDDFNGMNSGASFGKRSYAQCCNVCYPLFLFIILAACVMACAGLIWMQIALKEDLDALKEKLHSMESSQKTSSSEIPKLSEELKNEERKLDDLENGSAGLNKLWSNLTEINRKISLLDSAVNHLKANLKSAADLISLPTTVEELQKSVATIGSTLTSVQHDVKTMQDALEHERKDEDAKKTTDISDLRKAMSAANRSEEQHHTWTDEQIHVLLSTVADLHHRVASLENGSKPGSQEAAVSGGNAADETAKEATTGRSAEKEAAAEPSPPASPEQSSRTPRFLSRTRQKRRAARRCSEKLQLPFVTSAQDVDSLFGGSDPPGVSLQDVKASLGPLAPSDGALACFDWNGDAHLSLSEIKAAAGL